MEIQAEARKVAEENKKLRTLLHRHGILDDGIEEFLVSGTVVPPRRPASDTLPPPAVANTVRTLEQVLKPKPPRCFSPCKPSHPPSDAGGDSRQADAATTLETQEPSITGASSTWEIPALPNDMPSSALQGGQIPAPQYITAATSGTVLSRTDAAVALKPLGSSKADNRIFPRENMALANVACGPAPQQPYVYNTHVFSSSSGYPPPHPPPRQLLSLPSSATSSAVLPNYLQAQSTEDSCTVVAPGLISVMAGLETHSVRGQLGYMHDTASFGNVVDRYTTATTMGI